MYGYHMPLGGLMGFLILVVFIIVIYRIFKGNPEENSAEKILNERYAKGEIEEEEFKRMKENLKS